MEECSFTYLQKALYCQYLSSFSPVTTATFTTFPHVSVGLQSKDLFSSVRAHGH